MATLKCLACGYDNNVGDESCKSCSSSLNLRLCSVCEAINAHSAQHCHSCKVEFGAEPEGAATLEADAPPREGEAQDAAPVGRMLPAAWRLAAEQARKRSTKSAVTLWVLPLVAAGAGYYFYAVSQAPQKPQVGAKVEASQKSPAPAAQAEAAPREPAKPQTVELKPPQAPAVSGKITAPKTASAPVAKSPAPAVPKRTTTSVTHTRSAGAALPVATTAVTAAPASNAAAATTSEPPAAIPERRGVQVTHTKAVLTEAPAATTAPVAATAAAAAASEGRSVRTETTNDEPAGCAAAVAALGLCKSK
jgi:hypothetical protein